MPDGGIIVGHLCDRFAGNGDRAIGRADLVY
jgi:hypothetical protein